MQPCCYVIWVWVPDCLTILIYLTPAPKTMDTERVFFKYYAELWTIVNPNDITGHLFLKGLISMSEKDDVYNAMHSRDNSMRKLLSAVQRAIEMDNSAFYNFLKVLDGFPKYKLIVERMRSELHVASKLGLLYFHSEICLPH